MFGRFKKKEIEWPFDQPKNCAVFTIRQIIEGESPIQIVYHDLEDDGWQFVSNIQYTMEDAKLVGLEEITKIDPSIFEVARIEPGYHAWRNAVGDKWTVEKTPDAAQPKSKLTSACCRKVKSSGQKTASTFAFHRGGCSGCRKIPQTQVSTGSMFGII